MDLSLNEEQQAFRDLARDFLDREAIPHRTQWDRDESVDLDDHPQDGRDRVLRAHHPRGVRRPRRRLPDLRARHGGARPRRLRAARHRVGLQRAVRQVGAGLRHRGAEAGVAAADRRRHRARLLRAHRAGHRLRRRQPDLARPPATATDYVLNGQKLFITNGTWADVRAGLRPHQRRRPARRHGVPRPDRHPRLRGPRDQGQARAARPGHRRAVPLRRTGARRRRCSARRARASRSR